MSAKIFLSKMARKGFTIAFAESITGGALAYELVKHPGASHVLNASIVAYTIEQKMNLLGLDFKQLSDEQIVSKDVALLMARSIEQQCKSTFSVGVTGNAGPTLQNHTLRKEAFVSIIYNHEVKFLHLDLNHLTRVKAIQKVVKETYELLVSLV
jgi:PncC family amidohydrolase